MSGPGHDELMAQLIANGRLEGHDLSIFRFEELEANREFEFHDCRLQAVRIKSQGLEASHWSGCQFLNCEFAGCDLREAVFRNCRFFDVETAQGCIFRFSELRQACFHDCDLSASKFWACDGFEIEFARSKMAGVNFDKMSFAHEIGQHRRNAALFDGCSLIDASLREIDLSTCVLKDCDLNNADLAHASLRNAELKGCDLYQADLDECDFSGADLRSSDLASFDLIALRDYQGLMISASQQHHLLTSLGIDVSPDEN